MEWTAQTSSYRTLFHVLFKPFSSPHKHTENSRILKYVARWTSIFNALLTRVQLNFANSVVGFHKKRDGLLYPAQTNNQYQGQLQTPQSATIPAVWTSSLLPYSGRLRRVLYRRMHSYEADRTTYVVILSVHCFIKYSALYLRNKILFMNYQVSYVVLARLMIEMCGFFCVFTEVFRNCATKF